MLDRLPVPAFLAWSETHWLGSDPELHVPVGKLHNDRYLPLHPNLVALIDDYRARFVPPDHPLLLPRPNGTALDRHAVTRMINRAGRRRRRPTSDEEAPGGRALTRSYATALISTPAPKAMINPITEADAHPDRDQ
jgi:hypothetical protein